MIDHSENTLRAAITCLRETVAPAVDPTDPQAGEQLRLTIDFLEFLRTRLYDVHARHRYELGHQIQVAGSLLEDARVVSDQATASLDAALATARAALADAGAHTADLRRAGQRLWAGVRTLLRAASDAPPDVRERIESVVLGGVEPLIEMESAWYLPFGFDPRPDRVPAVGDLVGGSPSTGDDDLP